MRVFEVTDLKEFDSVEAKEDDAWNRGQGVDWNAFGAFLAMGSYIDPSVDGILALGVVGAKEAQGVFNDLGKPAKINYKKSLWAQFGKWSDQPEGGHMNPVTGVITMNPEELSDNFEASNYNYLLRHELRHRGFKIVREVPSLLAMMPKDLHAAIKKGIFAPGDKDFEVGKLGHSMTEEHKMIYAMDGKNIPDASYWRSRYIECAEAATKWIRQRGVNPPKGAPDKLRAFLEKVWKQPVELVAPGETPEPGIVGVKVPKSVAQQASKPAPQKSTKNFGSVSQVKKEVLRWFEHNRQWTWDDRVKSTAKTGDYRRLAELLVSYHDVADSDPVIEQLHYLWVNDPKSLRNR